MENNTGSVRIQGNLRLGQEHFLGLAISPFYVGGNFWFPQLAVAGATG